MKTVSPAITEAIGYLRFSDPTQRKGGSTERQDSHITTACEEQGWNLITILAEEGRSGYHGHHRRATAVLGRFEAEALAGEHRGRILVVERLDRLSRQSAHKTWNLICKLSDAGVSIYTTVNAKLYRAGEELPMFDMLEILFRAFGNNEESAKKAAHIANEWEKRRAHAKANKLALTRLCAPWIIVNPDRTMKPNDERGALVLRWFHMARDGHGAKTIADILDAEGIEPWARFENRTPKKWNRTFIANTLRNREVLGEYQPMVVERDEDGTERRVPEGEPWIDHLPQIVPADLFATVNREAAGRKATALATPMNSTKIVNLFSGLIECQECGSTLEYRRGRAAGTFVAKGGKSYSYKRDNGSLVCPLGTSKTGKCSNSGYLAYLTFEDALLGAVLHLALDDTAFSDRGEIGRLNVAIAERERGHELAAAKAGNLYEAFSETPSPILLKKAQEAEAAAADIMVNLEGLRRQREEARGRVDSAAHLRRVADVRSNLYHDDLSIRTTLRKKVSQAIRALIVFMRYDGEGVTVYIKGGLAFMRIDRKGVVSARDLTNETDKTDHPEFMRRREAVLAKGRGLFEGVDQGPIALDGLSAVEPGGTKVRMRRALEA